MAAFTTEATRLQLLRFAERECEGRSPLYQRLAQRAANDEFILDLLADRRACQPAGNILLAAVQYLLYLGFGRGLREFYPNFAESPTNLADIDIEFSHFCRRFEQDIRSILRRRTVGTNEAARSAGLYPALITAARNIGGISSPVHFIEIGASAGLNLMWDRYSYNYGGTALAGLASSPVVLHCEVRTGAPPLEHPMPSIASRCGIDLAPLDVWRDDDVVWLRALVWPEHVDRIERLNRALEIARDDPPHLIIGDAIEVLPDVLASLAGIEPIVVFHSFTVNQFTESMRNELSRILVQAAGLRSIARVSFEWDTGIVPELWMTTYSFGTACERLLARADAHGAWLDWRGA